MSVQVQVKVLFTYAIKRVMHFCQKFVKQIIFETNKNFAVRHMVRMITQTGRQTVPTFSCLDWTPWYLNHRVSAIYVYVVIANKQSRTFILKYLVPDATVKIMLIKMSKCVKQRLKFISGQLRIHITDEDKQHFEFFNNVFRVKLHLITCSVLKCSFQSILDIVYNSS